LRDRPQAIGLPPVGDWRHDALEVAQQQEGVGLSRKEILAKYVNVVRLSIDGGKTWFNATQSATPGVWDYTWLADVGEGKHTLT
ncbi:hypothetical protein ONK29_27545, partial [Salmonella enterica subsp. enterica serovar Anatum]|nr:hypothetical protein [Salmonella enterica subsp. enterica serovar Anatum]